jgi:hypothetical protein
LVGLFEGEEDLDDDRIRAFVRKTFISSVNSGNVEIIKASLKAGADVNARWSDEGLTALCVACRLGRLDVVECLLKANANEGSTPLMESASVGHLNIVKRLIEAGALVNAARKDGITAIELAREGGHREIVEALGFDSLEASECI